MVRSHFFKFVLFVWAGLAFQALITVLLFVTLIYIPKVKEVDIQGDSPSQLGCNCNTPATISIVNSKPNSMSKTLLKLFIITATYPRLEQLAELTRMGQTLKNVENILWIVADDAENENPLVLNLLNRLGVSFKYLLGPMPSQYWRDEAPPKGVPNRNAALEWLKLHLQSNHNEKGIIYIADDDNTYDIQLFSEIRKTKRISAFPVGLVTERPVSTPVVIDGRITDFYDGWVGNRSYPLDMAGFAFSTDLFVEASKKGPVAFPYTNTDQEEALLKLLGVPADQFEPLAGNCSQIFVWHTRTRESMSVSKFEDIPSRMLRQSNLGELSKYWCMFMGLKRCDGLIENEKPFVPLRASLRERIKIFKKRENS